MIIWIASYPKSGNTWLRALISSYYYSESGDFNFNLLESIESFPKKKFFLEYSKQFKSPTATTYYWDKAQDKINANGKLNFLKTHNSLCNIDGNNFADKKNTLGCIYIIRDPRNVLTSIKNHYELNYHDSLRFMLNKKKFIYDRNAKNDFGNIQFIGSWKDHYNSWVNTKMFRVKLIKYEDLLQNTFKVFKEIVDFINQISKSKISFDPIKAKNSVNSTSFSNLKYKELKEGFSESIYSNIQNKKITFFNLGPKNDWVKIVPKKFHDQINLEFKDDLKFTNYK